MKIGTQLPDLQTENQEGKTIKLHDFKGKKLVIFFYPKASTPGCTAEACNLSDNFEKFQDLEYNIVGISADTVKKQKSFHTKFQFKYDLLADISKEIIEAFGVWGKKKFWGKEYMGILRTTFIFDENGICTQIISEVDTKNHTEQILV